jgi:hypothetical protein
MPKYVLSLTDAEVKAAKLVLKRYQMYDGKGVYLGADQGNRMNII